MKMISKILLSMLFFCSLATTVLAQEPREFEHIDGDTTYIMKRYYMGFLKRVDNKPEIDSIETARIQQAHLDYMSQNASDGVLLMAGPFSDDGEVRGIVIYDVETLAEAEKIISNDPAIKAGRLGYELHPWWAAKGATLK